MVLCGAILVRSSVIAGHHNQPSGKNVMKFWTCWLSYILSKFCCFFDEFTNDVKKFRQTTMLLKIRVR